MLKRGKSESNHHSRFGVRPPTLDMGSNNHSRCCEGSSSVLLSDFVCAHVRGCLQYFVLWFTARSHFLTALLCPRVCGTSPLSLQWRPPLPEVKGPLCTLLMVRWSYCQAWALWFLLSLMPAVRQRSQLWLTDRMVWPRVLGSGGLTPGPTFEMVMTGECPGDFPHQLWWGPHRRHLEGHHPVVHWEGLPGGGLAAIPPPLAQVPLGAAFRQACDPLEHALFLPKNRGHAAPLFVAWVERELSPSQPGGACLGLTGGLTLAGGYGLTWLPNSPGWLWQGAMVWPGYPLSSGY